MYHYGNKIINMAGSILPGKIGYMSVKWCFSCLFLLGLIVQLGSAPAFAGVFDNYSGTWRGSGKVFLKNNRRETVKCKIKSIVEVYGSRIYHTVKCKSDSQKIKVRISLSSNGRSVVGNWSASGAVDGDIRGIVKGNALKLQLSGRRISASLYLKASNCRQRMSLRGKIGKIRKIYVQLRKSC